MPDGTAKGAVQTTELTRAQQGAARRAAEARATIPDVTYVVEAGLDAAPERPDAAILRAVALALHEHPRVNGAYRDGRAEAYGRVNLGVAVTGPGWVLVPTLLDADRKALDELDAELDAMRARATDGALTAPELAGATFTVTGLGLPPVRRVEPIVVPGQAAGLGVGAAERRVVAAPDGVMVARRADLMLACDARVLQGAAPARFLARVVELLAP